MSPTVDALDKLPPEALVDGLRRLGRSPAWLFAAADPEAVGAALRRRVPELASGELILWECQVSKLRVNRESVTALYRLTVGRPEAKQRRLLELSGEILSPGESEVEAGPQGGPIGSDRWRCYLPDLRVALRTKPTDGALPLLPLLTDPEAARALLERGIRAGSNAYADVRIQACVPQIARYKPGRRCTVLYRLEFPSECRDRGWPNPIVAKTHHGAEGRNAYDGLKALWASRLRSGRVVTIAEPLAFLPHENVVLQGPVPGQLTLKKLIESSLAAGGAEKMAELTRCIDKTAVGLAELHTCEVSSGKLLTWEDELAEIRESVAPLGRLEPELAGATMSLLQRLEMLAAEHPADRPGPAHRSFRPAQVLLHHGNIGFIDFDGFCQAEPALDLALFRAILKDIGVRALRRNDGTTVPGSGTRREYLVQVEELCDAFLERYEAIAPVSRIRVALWEALDLLGLVLNCWLKVKPQRLEHRLELLSRHLLTTGLMEAKA